MNNEILFKNSYENTVCVENILFSVIVNVFLNDKDNFNNSSVIKRLKFETMHSHSYGELFVCFDSAITITTPGENIHLNPGELLFVPSGTVHTKLPGGEKWASIGFSYSNVHIARNHNLYCRIDNLCKCTSPKILSQNPKLHMELYELLCEKSICKSSVCTVLRIFEILIQISENFQSTQGNNRSCRKNSDITRIAQLETILENRFTEDISPAYVAKELHISERQLGRILLKSFGMPLRKLIMSRRIKMACKMLCNTELPVEEIWKMVGFNNKSTFYTAFKKSIGFTPAEYKKMGVTAENLKTISL